MGRDDWALDRKLSVRPIDPVCQPLHDIHFLVQDGDDDVVVDCKPEDVVTLAPMDADFAQQLRQ